jgi:hypothetical protein
MQKLVFSILAVTALVAILLVPSLPTHVAKASTCSTSFNRHGFSQSFSSTTSGSCSSGSAIRQGTGVTGAFNAGGGSKSSCTAVSAGGNGAGLDNSDSNGAVSCSSHSP